MCLSPIKIKNLNCGSHSILPSYRKHQHWDKNTYSIVTTVPCGQCAECVALRQMYIVQRVQELERTHYLFMLTLTYKEEMLPKLYVGEYQHSYADFRDWQNMIKMMRKYNVLGVPFKYLVVSEYGGKFHRPHFHAIIFIKKELIKRPFEWSIAHQFDFFKNWRVNQGSTRVPVWKQLSDLKYTHKNTARQRCTYDFHWINPYLMGSDGKVIDSLNVAFYVTKYIMKFDKWLDRKRNALKLNYKPEAYHRVWKFLRPRCVFSHGLFPSSKFDSNNLEGIIQDYAPFMRHLKASVNRVKETQSLTYVSKDGKYFPACPMFRDILSRYLPRYSVESTRYTTFADSWNSLLDEYRKRLKDSLYDGQDTSNGYYKPLYYREDKDVESSYRRSESFYNRHSKLSDDFSDCTFEEYDYNDFNPDWNPVQFESPQNLLADESFLSGVQLNLF